MIKKNKKVPKTMKEVSERFEDFIKEKETKDISKKDFEKLLKKVVKKKSLK